MNDRQLIEGLYRSVGEACVTAPEVAHVEVHGNRVLGLHLVPGLSVEADEREDGVAARIVVARGVQIQRPVRICFGVLNERGVQRIEIETRIEEDARVAVMASCSFPAAVEVLHQMAARITLAPNAHYAYLERHVHSAHGGVTVVPHATVVLEEGAQFRTDFELLSGRAGQVDIDYDAECRADSVLEMAARVSGRGDDRIRIHERARLVGERARGVLSTSVAVRERARADVLNTMIASAAHARGHVDCKEIVQGDAVAAAVPVVEVHHDKAHVTHEAAIGSVDNKQLETLMSRGLSEDEATDLIIEGLLSPPR